MNKITNTLYEDLCMFLISCYEVASHLRHPSPWGTYRSRMYKQLRVDHRA